MRVLCGRWLARTAAIVFLATVWVLAAPGTPPADAQTCLADMTASNETELGFAFDCFNAAVANSITTVTFTQDIPLTAALPMIGNGAAVLEVQGQGHTLDGNGAVADALVLTGGLVLIDSLTITGATNEAISASSAEVFLVGSTLTSNGYGVDAVTGMVTLRNSTLVGNTHWGIRAIEGSVIESSTIADNGGLGIVFAPTATVSGSVIVNNTGDDCDVLIGTDGGGNLFGDPDCTGTATPGLRSTLDTGLAPNGCVEPCTETLALLPGSPAVDFAGTCGVSVDQRNMSRTTGSCDSGAFELGDCTSLLSAGDEASLNFAIACYNSAVPPMSPVISVTADIVLSSPLVKLDNSAGVTVLLNGAGHKIEGTSGVQDVLSMIDGNLSIVDLTITGADDDGFQALAGSTLISRSTITGNAFGINAVTTATVRLENVTVFDNLSWGVRVSSGAVVETSTIVDNGGNGIRPGGAATVTDSVVANNAGGDCDALIGTDLAGNLFSDDTCNGTATTGLRATLAPDLASNGCAAPCTETLALLPGSPAVDAAGVCSVAIDQRNMNRTAGSCDAGAFELGDADGDGDGFEGPLGDGADCDDTDPAVNPGADEVADDGIDQDCDGADLVADAFCGGALVTIRVVAGVVTTGTSGVDVILGTAGPDVINALDGDDLICGLGGDDVIDAGDGNDTVFADSGLDTVVGGNGNDTLWGGPDRDIMRGGPDVDVLHGEGGDDRLLGGIGGDTLNGGDGDDYLGGFGGGDTINGGPGNETIFGGFGADVIDGGPGNDEIFGLIGNDTIMGGPGDDKLNGDRGNDTIEGGPGNDIIRGGNANDVLRGDAGDDSVSGGKADDSLSGGADTDVCVGNLQNVADTADATCETIFGVP